MPSSRVYWCLGVVDRVYLTEALVNFSDGIGTMQMYFSRETLSSLGADHLKAELWIKLTVTGAHIKVKPYPKSARNKEETNG